MAHIRRPELVKKQASENGGTSEATRRPSLSPETYRPSKRSRISNTSSDRDQLAFPSTSIENRFVGRVTRSGSHRGTTQVAAENSIVIGSDTDEDGAYEPGSSGSILAKASQSKVDEKDYRSLQGEC